MSEINPIDRDALRQQVRDAVPFPHFKIDHFLDPAFAEEVQQAYPSYDQAMGEGFSFNAVNEKGKVQLTDSSKYPPAVAKLNDLLASADFLDLMSYVMDIPELMADASLVGGGMHMTGPRGRFDVHVDFNYHKAMDTHRRLNILVFLNPQWKSEWGGVLELWDKDVKVRHHAFEPIHNRCVVFATNDISYHGVTAVTCPPDVVRRSFAAYYYTKYAPPEWTGEAHSTIFKARPDEVVKGKVLMPLEKFKKWARQSASRLKHGNK